MELKLKVGDKVKYKDSFQGTRPKGLEYAVYEILAVDPASGLGYILDYPNKDRVVGAMYKNYTWSVNLATLDVIPEVIKPTDIEITYDEPEEDEFTDKCLDTCKPGNHQCK